MNYWMEHVWPDEVDDYLGVVLPFLHKLEPGYSMKMSPDDIVGWARGRRMFFDIMMDINDKPVALLIIEPVHYPRARSLRIMGAVGDIGAENLDDAIIHIDQYVTELASKSGYGFVEYEGRKGWTRRLKRLGVPIQDHHVVIKRVEESHESSHQDCLSNDGGPHQVRTARR